MVESKSNIALNKDIGDKKADGNSLKKVKIMVVKL